MSINSMKWYWTSVKSLRWYEEVSSWLVMPSDQLLLLLVDHPFIISVVSLEDNVLLIPFSSQSEFGNIGASVGLRCLMSSSGSSSNGIGSVVKSI